MPITKLQVRVITGIVAAFVVVTNSVNVFVGKWETAQGRSASHGYVGAVSLGPSFAPAGDWVVVVNAPTDMKQALSRALEPQLRGLSGGNVEVRIQENAPVQSPGSNFLYVNLSTKEPMWTPVYATFSDTTEIRFSSVGRSDWPDSANAVGEVSPGEMRVRGTLAAAGKGYGLVGRPAMDAHRAELVAEFIRKSISDAYLAARAEAS